MVRLSSSSFRSFADRELLHPSEPEYTKAFLLTHHAFTTSRVVLEYLLKRYMNCSEEIEKASQAEAAPPASPEKDDKKKDKKKRKDSEAPPEEAGNGSSFPCP